MINQFVEALQKYSFLQIAFLSTILIGIISGIVGSINITRGNSLLSDAIAHAVLPGIVISNFFNIPIYIGGIIFGLISSLIIDWIKKHSSLRSDSIIGVVFTTFFALGILLLNVLEQSNKISDILFGNILSTTINELIWMFAIVISILLFFIIFFEKIELFLFNNVIAKTSGVNTFMLEKIITLIVTASIVVLLQSVGVILVTALLVIPSSISLLFSNSFFKVIIFSSLISLLSSIFGLIVSYYFSTPSGPTIVLSLSTIFLIIFLIKNFLCKGQFKICQKIKK